MRIIVITPVYPSKNAPVGTTPVVHYFAKEWVSAGHDVTVFHLEVKYPFFVLWVTKLFEKYIYSKIGFPPPTKTPVAYSEIMDGVLVFHFPIKKIIRSDRFKKEYIEEIYQKIRLYCGEKGTPDLFIGHWDSPQVELLNMLKTVFPNVKNAIVFHSLGRDFRRSYSADFEKLFRGIDNFGFRSHAAMRSFCRTYFTPRHTFLAASGISDLFIKNGSEKSFEKGIHRFVFVGALINRKHPVEVLNAVSNVFINDEFSITYIGEGVEKDNILKTFKGRESMGTLELTGRIERAKVVDYYKESDVFVMISSNETFGLVYLEAMAMGCITIASYGGGVDGIIVNGVNGFLCNPGDQKDLEKVLMMIKGLSAEELRLISRKGIETARNYSDKNVAMNYLNAITC